MAVRWRAMCSASASSASAAASRRDPQPRLFSFNNPFGACATCHGFGNIIELDLDLVVPDPARSIRQGAIEPWARPHYRAQLAALKRAARSLDIPLDVPWQELTPEQRRLVVEGDGVDYEGIRGFFRWLERKKYTVHVRVFLSRCAGTDVCGGTRLRREARDVRVGAAPSTRCRRSRGEVQRFFDELSLSDQETAIAEKVLREIGALSFLRDVGLDYLTLDRLSSTLSGGESQRINLATSLGSALVDALRPRRAVGGTASARQPAPHRHPAAASRSGTPSSSSSTTPT